MMRSTWPLSFMKRRSAGPTDPYWSSVVALWPFDEADGATSFTDYKNGHTLTRTGDPTGSNAQAKFGSTSLRVNAAATANNSNFLRSDTSSDFTMDGDFTIEVWGYFYSQPRSNMGIVSRSGSDTSNGGFQFMRISSTSKMRLEINDGSFKSTNSTTSINANTWYHFAVDRSGSNLRLYVNGSPEGSPISTTGTFFGGNFEIGLAHTASDQASWTGHIQDVRVTKGVARYAGSSFSVPTDFYPRS